MSTPEGALLRLTLDYLAARHVLAFRLNTGAIKMDKCFVRFGVPGMSDILAFKREYGWTQTGKRVSMTTPIWLECKAPKGRQSALQSSFQAQVESHGHIYKIVRDIGDVEEVL